MKRWIRSIVWLSAAWLILCSHQSVRGETKADDAAANAPQAPQTIAGVWSADSVSMLAEDGKRKNVPGHDSCFNVTISDSNLTMRVRDKVLADLAYVLDPKQDPWTIDLKSADGVLLGICARKGDQLQISLNDQAKGRPSDFDKTKNGMVLALKPFSVRSFYLVDADGSNLRQILTMPNYTTIGSPRWSHDGKRIAFDAWRSIYGEEFQHVQMLMVNADGSGMKVLGPGAMPSWSPDDKQLAFSCHTPESGVYLMDADGSNRRSITLGTWGVRWSPKRNEIAYTMYENDGANLYVHDMAKDQRRALLDKAYRQIYWGFTWSPDSDWICFKGILPDGGAEIAAVNVEGEKKGFKVILPSSATAEFGLVREGIAWGGTGSQILLSMRAKNSRVGQVYVVDFSTDEPPKLFPGLPTDKDISNMASSPDGKQVLFCAQLPQ